MIYTKILHILGRNWCKFSNWSEGFIDIDKLDFFLGSYENLISWKLLFPVGLCCTSIIPLGKLFVIFKGL
jgi:hypothetical protein